jgi:predicted DNA-binding protein
MKRIMINRSIYLSYDTIRALKTYSEKNGRPLNWAVTNIIENWIKKNKKKCGA